MSMPTWVILIILSVRYSRQSGLTLNVELGVDGVDEKEVKDKILKHFKGFV
jgi:hypothetical protein